MEKTIDPSVQGTALQISTPQKNTKKLYLESYGCN